MKTKLNIRLAGLWLLTVVAFTLLSPKWLFAPAAWIAPALLLYVVNKTRFWPGVLWGWLALVASGLLANRGVMPFPGIFFVIMTLFLSLINIIPYVVSNWLGARFDSDWRSTLVFPSVLVTSEYVNSFGGGGTWGSLANTQFENFHLIQLASLGGIWCITFLIGWFASLLNWVVRQHFKWTLISKPIMLYAGVITFSLLYGAMQTNPYFRDKQTVVRIAGITANNVSLVKAMYEDYFDRKITIEPDALSQSSPELQELQKGLVKFIENPLDEHFNYIQRHILNFQDSLLSLADREAQAGAKLIAFSEGLFLTTKNDEEILINKVQGIAAKNKTYITFAMASLLPGKVEMGSKYIENKIIAINPEGKIEATFFKNKPVPVVEGSIPGDGEIPVINTPFGKVAISICYDADFPSLMRKASMKNADIMILPSGDWKEVSPFHARMAMLRAIENGFSLFRMASGATSIATDQHGRILSSTDFYTKGERIMIAHVPTQRKTTLYSKIGDAFAWGCIFLVVSIGGYALVNAYRTKRVKT
jgi:apolipoprotein N-acyltransferase